MRGDLDIYSLAGQLFLAVEQGRRGYVNQYIPFSEKTARHQMIGDHRDGYFCFNEREYESTIVKRPT